MRNGGFWFKVKVLSFKIHFCNGDSDAHLTPTTAHAQALAVITSMTREHTIKIIKYSCYFVGLPIIGFASMKAIYPLTTGAHDGGFFGMVIGIVVGQLLFSMLLLKQGIYVRLFLGLVTSILGLVLTYLLIGFFIGPRGQTDTVEIIFFVIYLLLGTLISETMNSFSQSKNQ